MDLETRALPQGSMAAVDSTFSSAGLFFLGRVSDKLPCRLYWREME
jgi:hypothetical protein